MLDDNAAANLVSPIFPGLNPTVAWENDSVRSAGGCVSTDGSTAYVVGYSPYSTLNFDLYAVSETSGAIDWSEPLDGGFAGECPAIDGGHLYVVGGTSPSSEEQISELDASNGTSEWAYVFLGSESELNPLVVGGHVLLTALTSASSDYSITALDETTGSVQWNVPEYQGCGGCGYEPTVAGSTMVLPDSSYGGIQGVSLSTGSQLWTLGEGYLNRQERATAYGNTLYVPTSEGSPDLVAVDATTGAVEWTSTFQPAGPISYGDVINMVADGSSVYASTSPGYGSTQGGEIAALSASDGSLEWSDPQGAAGLDGGTLADLGGDLVTRGLVLSTNGTVLGTNSGYLVQSSYGSGVAYDGGLEIGWGEPQASAGGTGLALVAYSDRTGPTIAVSGASDGQTTGSSQTLGWTVGDNEGRTVSSVEVTLDAQVVASSAGAGSGSYTASSLATGSHSWQVEATDALGNTSTSPLLTFTVNAQASSDTTVTLPARPPAAPSAPLAENAPITTSSAATPKLTIKASSLVINGGTKISVPVSCARAACVGTVKLVQIVNEKKAVRVRSGPKIRSTYRVEKVTTVLGATSFRVGAGRAGDAVIILNATGTRITSGASPKNILHEYLESTLHAAGTTEKAVTLA